MAALGACLQTSGCSLQGMEMEKLASRSPLSEFVLLSVNEKIELLNEWMYSVKDDMLRKSE